MADVRLLDIPKLPKTAFHFRNSCRHAGVPQPARLNLHTGKIEIEQGFAITGWCERPDELLMHGREGQILLMFFHPDEGEIWEHYPLFDEDERSRAVFQCITPPLIPVSKPSRKPARMPKQKPMPRLIEPRDR